jgi:hypothetical protein
MQMLKRRANRIAGVLGLLTMSLYAVSAFAQGAGATLQGTLTDAQGGMLPGVTVTVTNVDSGFTRSVVTDDRGWYRAAALNPGQYEVRAVLLGFLQNVRSGLTLTIGQEATVNFTLQLEGVREAVVVTGDAPMVETSDNSLGSTITRTQLDSLPLAGRDFSQLARTAPGVAGVGGGGLSSGGQLTRNNSFVVDGVSFDQVNNATTRGDFSLETVQEYVVVTNMFQAEYGLASGALVSVVTRSGTNAPQGRAFVMHRNENLDAQNPFSKALGAAKSPFSLNRFGGFFGGPIVHDQLHYFASYEGLRTTETNVVTSPLVPVDQREHPAKNNTHLYFIRSDYQMNSNHSFSGRYRMSNAWTYGNGIGGLNAPERGSDQQSKNQDVVVSHKGIFGSRGLNEARFQFARQYADNFPYSPLGTPEILRPSGNFGKPYNQPQGRTEDRFQFIENFAYSRGTHNLKAGADISLIRVDAYFYNNMDGGTFRFTTDRPFDANDLSTYPVLFTRNIGSPFTQRDTDLYGFFVQDTWRVRPDFTLNLGLRYDMENAFKKAIGLQEDRGNLAPRVGFAWDPFGDQRTAIRGGFGIFVDNAFLNITANIQAARQYTGITINNPGYPDPNSRGSVGPPEPPSTVIAAPEIHLPRTRQLSIGVKREVFSGLSVSADYVNNRAMYLYNGPDINSPDPITRVRPNPNFLVITQYETTGNSWYNALLMSIERRPGRRGPTWSVSYTLADSVRDVEDFQSVGQDPLNRAAEKSLANNHRRHQVVGTVTWSLPGGFQVGAILEGRSGRPWNVTTGADNNGNTNFNDRPDLAVPGGDPNDRATYFANFTGRVGNLPRNFAMGPGFFEVQARVSKMFTMGRYRLDMYGEAFNLLNSVNLGNPNGNLRSSQFGRSTGLAGNPRQVEVGFRFNF